MAAASLPLLLFYAVPLISLLLRTAPAMVVDALAQSQVMQAIALSLATSTITTLLTLVLGLPVAWILARRTFRGKAAVHTLVDLPMVLPPAVAGIALLTAFGRRGLLGQWLYPIGITVVFTPVAVIMAQLFVASPFFVKAAAAGFTAAPHDMEEAALLDGASPWQVFSHITLPLSRNILLSGAVMTWARALGEFGATIIFAGNFPGRTQTMPLAIYLGFELDLLVALTLSVVLMVLAFGVLLLVRRVFHGQIASVTE